jgi:Trk K+ transport system NAD-binding subunit
MKHSIIVGFGLAGFHYAQQLKSHNKDFLIIDTSQNSASRNAAGICNPTVLKR